MQRKEYRASVAVLGASGYVGNRLVAKLLDENFKVLAAARCAERLNKLTWSSHPSVELVEFDALDQQSVELALGNCTHAFYLVHSMNSKVRQFREADRSAAENLVRAAEITRLRQLIYLGGLGGDSPVCSEHLLSREEVGQIFQRGGFSATILRAGMIIGSGSASYEMLRYVVQKCPIMLTPKYVDTLTQPIAITNVLNYLVGCIDNEETLGKTLDLGGLDLVTYRQIIDTYAEEASLPKRRVWQVPLEISELSVRLLGLLTPLQEQFIRVLLPGVRSTMICKDQSAQKAIPQKLLGLKQAIERTCDQRQREPSDWGDYANDSCYEWSNPNDPTWSGGQMFVDTKKIVVRGAPSEVWDVLRKIGGSTGWYCDEAIWQLRGFLDLLVGGVGFRKGRTDPSCLVVGDQVDWWKIKTVLENRLLVLQCEMSLPGTAWLEYRINPVRDDRTEISQTVRFIPRGLAGELYWHVSKVMHGLVFQNMLSGLARATKRPIVNWTPWSLIEDMLSPTPPKKLSEDY